MSTPASRYDDSYLCTQHMIHATVFRPEPAEVFIGGQLAAKLTDFCTCGLGHISPIAEGASEVLIRDLPAARLGVKTADGGVVIGGEPTVLVGSESFALPACMTIEGEPGFQALVLKKMFLISSTPSGRALLASVAEAGAHGRKVTICQGNGDSHAETVPRLQEPRPLHGGSSLNDPRAADGTGTDAKVYFDPGASDAKLFHETMHANDIMRGTLDERVCDNPGGAEDKVPCFERKAIGASPYDDQKKYPFSEKTYRAERGYDKRDVY